MASASSGHPRFRPGVYSWPPEQPRTRGALPDSGSAARAARTAHPPDGTVASFVSFGEVMSMSIAASESEQAAAAAVAMRDGRVVVVPRERDRAPIDVPESVVRVLAAVLDHAQRGETVQVVADDREITTQQAADLLGVSRPYLVGLVDRGEVPARKVGARRRLRLADVLLYRDVDQARRLRAADALAVEAQGLGLY